MRSLTNQAADAEGSLQIECLYKLKNILYIYRDATDVLMKPHGLIMCLLPK